MVEVKVIDVTPKRWGEELIASYLILGSKRTLLIETGPAGSYDQLKARLEEEGVRPDLVIVTHIHLDHAGAVGNLVRDYPNVKILVHPRGAKHLANPGKLWSAAKVVLGVVAQVYGEPLPVPESNLEPVEDGYVTDIGDGMVRIIHTPGHASHHMSILLEPDGILFTGDSAGVSVIVNGGRIELPTTPPPFHPNKYKESLEKMMSLNPKIPAPTHYGVLQENAQVYLGRELDRALRWYQLVKTSVSKGVDNVDEIAKILAERYSDARIALESGNPIISDVFYRGTVWGLVEAAKKELGLN